MDTLFLPQNKEWMKCGLHTHKVQVARIEFS
jgi:hypothetical protein